MRQPAHDRRVLQPDQPTAISHSHQLHVAPRVLFPRVRLRSGERCGEGRLAEGARTDRDPDRLALAELG
eukprot:188052-Rhodomonas_salina.1